MKVRELIEKLSAEGIDAEAEAEVVIDYQGNNFKFSGFGVDDNNNIELYVTYGDELH